MLIASILFVGSLVGNPAFPDPRNQTRMPGDPRGVFAVTRHPMMWGFGLWGLCHIAVFPDPSNLVLAGSIAVLALVGADVMTAPPSVIQGRSADVRGGKEGGSRCRHRGGGSHQ